MDPQQIFILAMMVIFMAGATLSVWIRARHGYPIETPADRIQRIRKHMRAGLRRVLDDDEIDDKRKVELLTGENEKLVGQVGRLEERIAVLERIATDPAERTAREIDALRDR